MMLVRLIGLKLSISMGSAPFPLWIIFTLMIPHAGGMSRSPLRILVKKDASLSSAFGPQFLSIPYRMPSVPGAEASLFPLIVRRISSDVIGSCSSIPGPFGIVSGTGSGRSWCGLNVSLR